MEDNSKKNISNFNIDLNFIEFLGYLIPGTFFTLGCFLLDFLPIQEDQFDQVIPAFFRDYFREFDLNLYTTFILFILSYIFGVFLQLLGSFIRWFIRVTINEPFQGFIKEKLTNHSTQKNNNKAKQKENYGIYQLLIFLVNSFVFVLYSTLVKDFVFVLVTYLVIVVLTSILINNPGTRFLIRLKNNIHLKYKSDFIFNLDKESELQKIIKNEFDIKNNKNEKNKNEKISSKQPHELTVYDLKAFDNIVEEIVLYFRKKGSSNIIKRYDKFIGYIGLCQGLCASSIILFLTFSFFWMSSNEYSYQYGIASICFLFISLVTLIRRIDFNKYADLELALEYINIKQQEYKENKNDDTQNQ